LAGTFGNAVKAIVLPSLGFMTSGSINRRMDKPGKSPVTREEFLADWDTRGLDRWSKSLDRAGLKMEDVQDDLTILDTAMRGQISSMEEGAVINDRVMKDIYDEASKTLPAQSRLRKEFNRLSTTFKEIRVNLRKSMITKAGFATERVGKKEMAVIQGRRVKVGGDKAGFTKAGTGVTQAQLIRGGAVGSVLGESMDGGARTSVGAASPAKDGQKLVNDYVEGMEAGARANVAEARQSGAMVKGAFLSGAAGGAGIIGAAATQAGGEAGGGGMGVIPMGAPLMGDDQPKGPRSDINTRKEIPGDVDKASDSVDDLDKKGRKAGRGLMGLVMAMTMVAGSASMMEGKIGETAQSLFPLMMGLDALMIPLMMMGGGGGGGGLLSGVAGGLGAIGGAGAAAAAGVAAIVALIVAAVAAFATAIKRSESFRQVFVDLFNTLKEAVSPFTRSMEELGEKSGSILEYISNLWNTAVGIVAANVSVVVKGIEIIVKILTMARNIFWGLIGVIVNFVGSLGPVGAAIKNTFEGFRNFFANIPQLARQALLNVTKFIDKMVNNAIDGLNKLINAYNEVASRLGVDTIKPIENINLTVTVLQATGMRGSGSDVLANRELEKQEAKETARDSFRQTPLPPEEPDPEGTGGSKEKSFLEKLKEDLAANAKLYLDAEKGLKGYMKNRGKFLGAFQKLRNRGLSEDIISSLGTGPEGLKNAKELLKKNREQIKKLSEASRLASLGETVESLRREKEKTKEKTAAAKATEGLSPELQDIVMNNEQFISSFAKVKVGSKEYNKLVKEVQKLANAKRKLAEETQTEFEAQEQATKAMIDSLELQIKKNEDDLINAFEKTHGMLPEMMELEISKREESIRVIQKQIDELEELNEIDQERIEGLSRQKEMLERQIEVLDRANEMDQRRIELLNRQDEIRSRESKALSKELDDMSKIEQELRDSHEKRVEQLEKVADVNDYILNQQKQQLNISRAISEGDIYSATAAAQEMRAGSAAFSERQLISGLEAGLENQVSNLRTSDGLTRDQAERQIANIKEQSYQTSLQIRQIEDMIYQRNQQMIPLKDQQYSLDMQIRDIEDLIYDRNVQKKQIFDEQIDPLQTQNNLQNEYLRKLNIEIDHVNGPLKAKQNHLDRILELEGASQKVTGEIRDMTIKARKKADELSGSWDGVTKSIVSALGALSQFNGAKAAKSYAGGTVKSYAGGIVEGYSKGGKIKGYSVGGVAGNGSRDSVPAMLTPGEFVIRKAMVNKYGQSMMHDINMGSFSMPGYGAPGRSSNVSPADVSVSNISSINAPVYNVYDMNFSINGSNQSADEIANRVMVKMRQLQSHNIRSNRGN
jgi:hypothetical protein